MSQMQQQQPEPAFPLAGIAMEFLRKDADGQEKMSFCAQGKEALDVGLEALFLSGKPAAPALSELLGLAKVLEEQQASPAAAELIRRAITGSSTALKALGINIGDTTTTRRTTTRLLGGEDKDQAPVFGAAAPKGALSVSKLIDPMQMDRARAQKSPTAPAKAPATPKASPSSGATRRKFN